MTRPIVPAILALCAAGSAAALDHEFAFAPLVLDAPPADQAVYHVEGEAALKSKVLDDYRPIHDDAALGLRGTFRAYGLGLTLDTDWALGQARDFSRPGNDTTQPGEVVRAAVRADWALEIRDLRDASIPLLQIIPKLTYITYPSQRDVFASDYDNWLKDRQRWLGADVWWMLPIEGIELGAGFEQNISTAWRAFRGGIGAREFVQYNALDIAAWQMLNFGDREYREVVGDKDSSGLTTFVLGGRITTPMFVKEVYAFAEGEISYWMSREIRDNFRDAGLDGGNLTFSVGLTWLPE